MLIAFVAAFVMSFLFGGLLLRQGRAVMQACNGFWLNRVY